MIVMNVEAALKMIKPINSNIVLTVSSLSYDLTGMCFGFINEVLWVLH